MMYKSGISRISNSNESFQDNRKFYYYYYPEYIEYKAKL